MHDLILKGGRIYDGSGMPSFIGDVAITNGRIEEIGRINASADRVIDVGGLAVAPGIIDFHTHFDAQLWWDPLASSSTDWRVGGRPTWSRTSILGRISCASRPGLFISLSNISSDADFSQGKPPVKVS